LSKASSRQELEYIFNLEKHLPGNEDADTGTDDKGKFSLENMFKLHERGVKLWNDTVTSFAEKFKNGDRNVRYYHAKWLLKAEKFEYGKVKLRGDGSLDWEKAALRALK
jgi:hypothetical protein